MHARHSPSENRCERRSVHGAADWAFSKDIASLANASSRGDVGCGYPINPKWSARRVSTTINTTGVPDAVLGWSTAPAFCLNRPRPSPKPTSSVGIKTYFGWRRVQWPIGRTSTTTASTAAPRIPVSAKRASGSVTAPNTLRFTKNSADSARNAEMRSGHWLAGHRRNKRCSKPIRNNTPVSALANPNPNTVPTDHFHTQALLHTKSAAQVPQLIHHRMFIASTMTANVPYTTAPRTAYRPAKKSKCVTDRGATHHNHPSGSQPKPKRPSKLDHGCRIIHGPNTVFPVCRLSCHTPDWRTTQTRGPNLCLQIIEEDTLPCAENTVTLHITPCKIYFAHTETLARDGCRWLHGSHLLESCHCTCSNRVGLDNLSTGFMDNADGAARSAPTKRNGTPSSRGISLPLGCERPAMARMQCCIGRHLGCTALDSIPVDTHKANVTGFANMVVAAKEAGIQFCTRLLKCLRGPPRLPKVEIKSGTRYLMRHQSLPSTHTAYCAVYDIHIRT